MSSLTESVELKKTPKTLEALVCAQDWMRLPNQPITVKENLDEIEKLEKGNFTFLLTKFLNSKCLIN